MNECSHELQLEHAAILATLTADVGNIKAAVADFSVIKDTLIELKLLSEQSIKFNETQLASNKEVETTLYNINENLNKLNGRVENLEKAEEKEETSKTEIRVEDKRVSSERYKAKFTFYGVIIAGALTLIGIIVQLVIK